MVCPKCYAVLPDKAKFCLECGEAQAILATCSRIRRRRRWLALTAGVTVVLGAAIIGVVWQQHAAAEPTLRVEALLPDGARTHPAPATQEEKKGLVPGESWTFPGLGMILIPMEAGSFEMGSNSGNNDEKPLRMVRLTRDFWMGKTEVTQAQWRLVMGDSPSDFKGDDLPVEQVDWDRCMEFCLKLTDRERAAGRLPAGFVYRLPTEAEWEYAARGGNRNRGWGYTYSGGNDLGAVAWYDSNSERKTHPVGQKNPNELGLLDMSGNVWEWCLDWYQNSYGGLATTDPKGPSTGSFHVLRGGSWNLDSSYSRLASRLGRGPGYSNFLLGFRVVLAPAFGP